MNPEFIKLINAIAAGDYAAPPEPLNGAWIAEAIQRAIDRKNPPYLGMGNPDADILMVGREKALNPQDQAYWNIILHELVLNHAHWYDIVHHHAAVHPHDPALLGRAVPFTGFSPYNPLLWLSTWEMVTGQGHHTYQGMWTAVNYSTRNADVNGLGRLDAAAAEAWQWRLFDKVFITELNLQVAKSSRKTKFKLAEWLRRPRYTFMAGMGAPFYRRFKTVVIYTGLDNDYVGNHGERNRLDLVQLFNPTLTHDNRVVLHQNGQTVEEYTTANGSRVLITPHLSGADGWGAAAAIQQLLC